MRFVNERSESRKARLLVPTTIAKSMNRSRHTASKGRERPKDRKMTNDEMIECFNSAPKGSRHERMLWAACKIAGLTGATEGGAYKMLLVALIEAEGPDEAE